MSSSLSYFFRPRLYIKKLAAPAACIERGSIVFSPGEESGFASGGRGYFLAPFLQSRPELRKRSEFCATANEDGDLALQGVGIVGGFAHVFDVFEQTFQDFPGVVEHDQAISRIAAQAPQKISLGSAEGMWKSVAAAKEVDGARLSVVLREDAAALAFFGSKPAASPIHYGYSLFPP